MKSLFTSLLVLGILCALLLYLHTGSWSILAVLIYMVGASLYLWARQRGRTGTVTAERPTPAGTPVLH